MSCNLHEALQHLTKKKDKSNKVMAKFKTRSKESALITKTLGAFTMNVQEEVKKDPIVIRNDSKKAQKLAEDIEASIEGLGNIELPSR